MLLYIPQGPVVPETGPPTLARWHAKELTLLGWDSEIQLGVLGNTND